MSDRSQIAGSFLPSPGSPPVEWRIEPGLTAYPDALAFMEERADAIRRRRAAELVWLVEHPPSIPPAPAPGARISSSRTAFRYSQPGAAANTPITAPASGSPM